MRAYDRLASQSGLITRKQALGSRLSSSAIGRLLDSGEWKPVLPGVYRHVAASPSDLLMVNAAGLWLGPAAVLWGSWAAWWHELRSEPEGPVAMTVPRSHRSRSHQFVQLRRRDLHASDVTHVRGISVTTRALTALESVHLEHDQNTFDRALQRHLKVPELDAPIGRLWHAYGVVAAREAADLAADGTVSSPERQLAAALRAAGLHQVKAGVTVNVGGQQYWLDFAVVEIKLAIEVDGVKVHSDPEVFAKDLRRQNALVGDNWTMLRYTPWQVRNEMPTVLAQITTAATVSG